jgi:hypothetical protein
MALALRDCTFFGSAISESFALNDLEALLTKERLLEKATGAARKQLDESWESYRRKIRALGDQGGALRVRHHVLDPLAERLGYGAPTAADAVQTREDEEDGGFLYSTNDGAKLRAWAVDLGTDLDAPNQRGRAYRFSPSRVAERVLLAAGERVGLLTDGEELRLLIVDPARPGSHVTVGLGRSGGWRGTTSVPDSYRLVRALASPAGVAKIGLLTEAARLAQTRVTKSLRDQARRAVEGFVQSLVDHPANRAVIGEWQDHDALARNLWREGLVLVYRLLFVLKLEASADPARAFSFASTSLWRNTYSPNVALAPVVRDVVDRGAETGSFLADSLRATFRLFSDGLTSSELKVSPLGGMLFGPESAPLLSRLAWTEQGVASLLDNLFWTRERGRDARERVHYGSLDVEDLGRVYEALLELEPGIADKPMCRLRRAKLEVVVDSAAGAAYREAANPDPDAADDDASDDDDAEEEGSRGAKAKTIWVEDIAKGRFFLRVGLGRKATGSYYTPHPFVRFLVQETLGPQVAQRSPATDPQPEEILKLKVLDPAMGSGHFLVEACRFLGERLYEATRLCDGLAVDAEGAAQATKDPVERDRLTGRARELRRRVVDLPDPNDELVAYLPSRVAEGQESGISQARALAICRRLVAVHCLYGVDKNHLAVELAKVSVWLESYAEGLPLTFLDHRLICGDSLTAPFFRHLLTDPVTARPLEGLFLQRLGSRLTAVLAGAVHHVRDLEASVGKDAADLERKRTAKARLDEALAPFRTLSEVWSGLAKLGEDAADPQGWEELVRAVADARDVAVTLNANPLLREAQIGGIGCAAYEFLFPEVFFPAGDPAVRGAFDAVIGNPPWEVPATGEVEFLSEFAPGVHRGGGVEGEERIRELMANPEVAAARQKAERLRQGFLRAAQLACHPGHKVEELSSTFTARCLQIGRAWIGLVLPSSFRRNSNQSWLREALFCGEVSGLRSVHGFINSRRAFQELPPVLQFDLVVAGPPSGQPMDAAFGLMEAGQLFDNPARVQYSRRLAERLSPGQWLIIELVDAADAEVLEKILETGRRFGSWSDAAEFRLTQELNQRTFAGACRRLESDDDPRLPDGLRPLLERGVLPCLESKSIQQFTANWAGADTGGWDPVPHSGFPLAQTAKAAVQKAQQISQRCRYYRIAARETCGSPYTNERSAVFALVPPGYTAFHSALIEASPEARPNSTALLVCGFANSFSVDGYLRKQVGAHLSLFLLSGVPMPDLPLALIAHSSLRLSCNHGGYLSLWREQLGSEWRESEGKRPRFPVVEGDDARWAIRAAIDAVVADAYGLRRAQYEHVLASFPHRSYPDAPMRCLEAYDELNRLGLARFCKKHDPYFDIPLVETLPEPAIDLQVPPEAVAAVSTARRKGRAEEAPVSQLTLGEFQMAAEPVAKGPGPKRKKKGS